MNSMAAMTAVHAAWRTVAERTVAERTAADPRRAGWLEPLSSTWSRRAILALVIPALILLVAVLV